MLARSVLLLAAVGTLLQQRFVADTFSSAASAKWFSLIVAVQLPFVLLWNILIYPFYTSPFRNLPQAPQTKSWRRIFKEAEIEDCQEWVLTVPNDGFIRYLGLFNWERILVTDPQILTELFQTKSYHFVKPQAVQRVLLMVLGHGLVTSDGSAHKFQRKNLMPSFAFRRIKNLYPLFWDRASRYVSELDRHIQESSKGSDGSSAVVDITDWNQRVTLDIICEAAFGDDPNVVEKPNSEFFQQYRVGFIPSKGARIVRLLALLLPLWLINLLPMQRVKDLHAARTAVKTHLGRIIAAKKEAFVRGEVKEDRDIISHALRSNAFSDNDLLGQCMTMIAAGHETTSGAISWATYILSQNPDVQSKLREEVRSTLPSPSDGTPMTSELLDSLPYLNAFCAEVMRLHNPIPMIHRTAVVDTTLGETSIPKGTSLSVSVGGMSKSEQFWGSSAQEFRPERWIEGEKAKTGGADGAYSFMVFSQGTRHCIGSSFANAEFAACVAALVGRFDIKLERISHGNGLEVEHGIVTKIVGGLHLRLTNLGDW